MAGVHGVQRSMKCASHRLGVRIGLVAASSLPSRLLIALLWLYLIFSAANAKKYASATAEKHITLANYYRSTGRSNYGDYNTLQPGPNGLPQALELKRRTTECWVQYHYRTEKQSWDENADEANDEEQFSIDESTKFKVHSADGGYIPFLGITVVKDPKLYLLRLLHSIDYPIHDIVIVAGGDNKIVGLELEHIKENFANVTIIACSQMQSVTQGWNQLLTTYMAAPWMMISAIDVEFQPGSLQKFAYRFWAGASNGSIEIAYFSYLNLQFGKAHQRFNVFAITRALVDTMGLFDENMWPAYCEDEEWELRQRVMGRKAKNVTFFDILAYHGHKNQDQGHISSIREYGKRGALAKSRHMRNCMYIKVKWGCLQRYYADCQFTAPFNLTGRPVGFWRYNIGRFRVPKRVDLDATEIILPTATNS